jgi:hypothetical protein
MRGTSRKTRGAMGFDWAIRRSFSLGECKIEY